MKRLKWAWIVLSTSLATVFITYAIRFSYAVFLPHLMFELGLTKIEGGLLFTSYMIGYSVFSPMSGWLVDKLGGRSVIPPFCVAMGLGTMLMGTVTSIWDGLASMLVIGFGTSAMWVGTTSLLQRWFALTWRGKVLGVLNAGATTGYGAVGIFLPPIIVNLGWRAGWFVLGSISLVFALVGFVLIRSKPEDVGARPWGLEKPTILGQDEKKLVMSYSSILTKPNFWLVLLSYLTISFSTYIVMTFIVTFAYLELRFPYSFSSMLLSTMAVGGMVGTLALPALSDRFGRRALLMVCNAGLCLSVATLLSAASSMGIVIISTIAYGFFHEATYPIIAACSSGYFSPNVAGKVMGAWTLGYGLMALASPLIGGFMADTFGSFYWPFMATALASALGTVVLIPIREATIR